MSGDGWGWPAQVHSAAAIGRGSDELRNKGWVGHDQPSLFFALIADVGRNWNRLLHSGGGSAKLRSAS